MPSRKKGPASAAVSSAERVAVVGSGISGLSAAWLLQRAGKAVRGAGCCPPARQADRLAAAGTPARCRLTLLPLSGDALRVGGHGGRAEHADGQNSARDHRFGGAPVTAVSATRFAVAVTST